MNAHSLLYMFRPGRPSSGGCAHYIIKQGQLFTIDEHRHRNDVQKVIIILFMSGKGAHIIIVAILESKVVLSM